MPHTIFTSYIEKNIYEIHFLSPFRFSYIAILCLSLLHQLDKINVEKAVSFVVSCKNMDGGFGCTPGGESHSGQSMLAISLSSM